ncbi:MAG: hypothetical protein ACJ71E_03130 [Nitrososphaeraceae archaeon]
MTKSIADKIKCYYLIFLRLFVRRLEGFKVSFIDCSHSTFVAIREPQISSTEFRAFYTECNIYREIKEFRKGKFILIQI